MTEKPTHGVKGFVFRTAGKPSFFLRVYDKRNKKKFTDYEILTNEMEIELIDEDGWNSFYKDAQGRTFIDFSSKALGRKK